MKRKRKRNRMPKGMGTVYELKDKDRYGNYTHRKKPFVWYLNKKYMGSFETREEAELEARLYHRDHKESDDITFSELWNLWLEQKSGTISPHTVKNYQSKFRDYCKPLYNRAYKDLRPKDYLEIINSHPGTTNGTKNNTIKFLRAMDRFAYELDIIDKKYSENLEWYKKDAKRAKTIFTEKEISCLWEHQKDEDIDLILILLYSGLRSGELAELKLENINLEDDYMIGGFKTEAGTNRYVPIHPRVKMLIKNRVSLAKKDTLLNYSAKQFRIRFKKALNKLDMDHTPHECRHTFISRMDNFGANKVCTQQIVGHKGKDVTDSVYTHKTQLQLHEAIKLLP